jgi:hypothetical protein
MVVDGRVLHEGDVGGVGTQITGSTKANTRDPAIFKEKALDRLVFADLNTHFPDFGGKRGYVTVGLTPTTPKVEDSTFVSLDVEIGKPALDLLAIQDLEAGTGFPVHVVELGSRRLDGICPLEVQDKLSLDA